MLAGTALGEYLPREPVMFGTRQHFVPWSVGGREIRVAQKSGRKGRPAGERLGDSEEFEGDGSK